MNQNPTWEISIPIVQQLLRYLQSRGIEEEHLFRDVGFDLELLSHPEKKVPLTLYNALQQKAFLLADDQFFGMHLGEHVEISTFSILGYMMMNCATIGEAIKKIEGYERIIGRIDRYTVPMGGGRLKTVYPADSVIEPRNRHFIESVFSSVFTFMSKITGRKITPRSIGFTHPSPGPTEEYQRVFACPVFFEQEENYYTLEHTDLDLKIDGANPDLLAYFEEYARQLNSYDDSGDYSRKTRDIIAANLDRRKICVEDVAAELHMSKRSLQLKLEEEGTVFRSLLEKIRREAAERSLRRGHSIDEITYLLGYSESSTFCRAFKRWTGLTPGEYRDRK